MPPMSYLSPKTVMRDSPIHGRGLFASAPIRQGDIVCVKGGYIFDGATRRALGPHLAAAEIPVADDLFIGPRSAAEREGGMIFSNHSCEPNIGVQGQIVFVALRDIAAGEELTHDWATTDDDEYEMVCRCGAPSCRKIITGQDWRQPALQEKYRHCMSWYLLEKLRRQAQQDADEHWRASEGGEE